MNGLKFIRTRCNLSVAELADHIDVSRQIISAWENGTRGISSKNKKKLETFFGIDSKYFGEISEEDHKDILFIPMFRYSDGDKEYFKFKPSSLDDKYEFLGDCDKSLDDRINEANKTKRELLSEIDIFLSSKDVSDKLIVQADIIREKCNRLKKCLTILENGKNRPSGASLPYKVEINALLRILMVAFEIEDPSYLDSISSLLDFDDSDLDWAKEVTKLIHDHWQEKEKKKLERWNKAVAKKIPEIDPETASLPVEEVLKKAVQSRRRTDPEGKYYSTGSHSLNGKLNLPKD